MALQIWCPLIKDIHNQGISNIMPSASGATFTTSGKIGSGALNSSNEFSVTIPALSGKKVWSFCFWGYVVSSTITSNWTQIARINDGSSNFRVEVCPKTTSNGIYCYSTHNNSGYAISSESISSPNGGYYDQWAHFCLTSDGTTIFKYMNGELIGTCSYNGAGAITGTFVLTNNNRIYKNDLRVYDHCLSICELKAISSALVLHYPLNDAYVEGTTNLVTSITKGGQTTVNGYEVTTSGVSKDTYFTLNLSEKIVAGNTYTISCRNNFDTGLYWDFPIGSQANQTLTWRITSGYSSYTFVANSGNSYWDNNTCFMDDLSGTARNAGKSFKMWDWQIEKKDHATPFVIGTRNETTVHDCSGYQNNGTIFRALNCIGNSPRYKISTHFTSSIPSRIMLPSDMSCLSGNNEQTLSCWVRSSGLGSGMTQSGLISLGYGNTLFLGTSDYYYRIDNGSGLAAIGANQNPHDGNWHLVTATYKSGVASIYIDGVLKNSVSRTFSNRYINNGGNCIGTEVNNSPVYNLNGDISDIRMYATALSADDIKELYNTSAYVLDNGTLLTYSIEE